MKYARTWKRWGYCRTCGRYVLHRACRLFLISPRSKPVDKNVLIGMYRIMVRIRTFEERIVKDFTEGRIPGFLHVYIGEEAVAAGVCANLKDSDYITSTHRGHGHLIAKGGKTKYMMAELYGKKTGYNKGKGGSMHIADPELGILGANGIVGAGIPIAGGAALSAKLRKSGQVTVCFLGDGATNTCRFHEGVNFASVNKLPIVYVVENNRYAETTPISSMTNVIDVSEKAKAYGIPGMTVDGQDPFAVYESSGEALARARKGEGPTLLECQTFRFAGHYVGDQQTYRTKEEIEECWKNDPIGHFRNKLVEMGVMTEKDCEEIQNELGREIDDAVKYAEESPYPEGEETLSGVFA